jgi:hypothetical protein
MKKRMGVKVQKRMDLWKSLIISERQSVHVLHPSLSFFY